MFSERRYEEQFNDMEALYQEIEMSHELVSYFEAHKDEKDKMLAFVQQTGWWEGKCMAYAEQEEDYDPRYR